MFEGDSIDHREVGRKEGGRGCEMMSSKWPFGFFIQCLFIEGKIGHFV